MTQLENWRVPEVYEGDMGYIAPHIKRVVKLKVEREMEVGVSGVQNAPWFIEKHLEVVEDRTNWILEVSKEAGGVDRDEAMIAVWTHDLGRVMGWNSLHHITSAQKTREWLILNGLDEAVTERIYQANLKHRANKGFEPDTPLEKVIASADALSHFDGCQTCDVEDFLENKGFWYQLWKESIAKGVSDGDILNSSLRKMERDATSKQGFKETRERAEKEYEFLKENAANILNILRSQMPKKE